MYLHTLTFVLLFVDVFMLSGTREDYGGYLFFRFSAIP